MPDVLRVFLIVAEDRQWHGDSSMSLKFERALETAGLKGEGERRDQGGGGGRTYAAWLGAFGLWFTDSKNVAHSTFAGEDLLKGANPVEILTHQILNFQFPSPFSIRTRVDKRFKIFPFRFLLKLLLDERLDGYLMQCEMTGFVLPKAETDADLDAVVGEILKFRKGGSDVTALKKSLPSKYGEWSKIDDTANTFINQLEYTQLIDREDKSKIFIPASQRAKVTSLIAKSPALIGRAMEPEYFQRKFGLGPNHARDNRTFKEKSTVTAADTERSKVLLAVWDVLSKQPIKSFDRAIIDEVAARTGINPATVERIISQVGVQPSYDVFEQRFLQLSVGGNAFATEFEHALEGVFGKAGLGYETKWVGSSPNNPDVLAISVDPSDEYLGILDAKAIKAYTIESDHRLRMCHEYIPRYRTYSHNEKDYGLAFFLYVAGGLGSTINRGIARINTDAGVPGSAISAAELLALVRSHQIKPYTKTQLRSLFSLNRQILASDFT